MCKFNKVMDRIIKSLREIDKSLANIEKAIKEALRTMRGENG
jgi:hypothetical protein